MLTLLIAKFVTICNSRCRYMRSRITFINVWNVDHVAEL